MLTGFLISLRNDRQLILSNIDRIPAITDSDKAIKYLKSEFARESLEYPGTPPLFSPEAALWAARLIFNVGHLILFRKNVKADLEELCRDYSGKLDDSAILSADLSLRYLPKLIEQLWIIDPEDPLHSMLKELLIKWHYSGISLKFDGDKLDWIKITDSPGLCMMYVNRVIDSKNLNLALHPVLQHYVSAALGMYTDEIWKEFAIERKN